MMWTTITQAFMWLFSGGELLDFFSKELRSDFFNGFLSLAGFMLAAKTFIVIHMKQEVYDKPEYEEMFDERKRQSGESAATRYGPLDRMSAALYWIVLSSVVASVSQITIGLIPWNIAGILCVLSAAFAIVSLARGMFLIKSNLDRWFEIVHDLETKRELSLTESELNGTEAET